MVLTDFWTVWWVGQSRFPSSTKVTGLAPDLRKVFCSFCVGGGFPSKPLSKSQPLPTSTHSVWRVPQKSVGSPARTPRQREPRSLSETILRHLDRLSAEEGGSRLRTPGLYFWTQDRENSQTKSQKPIPNKIPEANIKNKTEKGGCPVSV